MRTRVYDKGELLKDEEITATEVIDHLTGKTRPNTPEESKAFQEWDAVQTKTLMLESAEGNLEVLMDKGIANWTSEDVKLGLVSLMALLGSEVPAPSENTGILAKLRGLFGG